MRIFRLITIITITLSTLTGFAAKEKKKTNDDGYRLEFRVKGVDDSMLVVANYFGLKQYYYDTAFAVGKETFVMEKDSIPGGIYLVVMPDKGSYFEVMVSGEEKSIVMETNFGSLVEDMKVLESEENKLFYSFQKEMGKKGILAKPIHEKMAKLRADSTGSKKDSIKLLSEKINKLNEEVIAYKLDFIKTNENSFVAKVFRTSQEPEVPENDSLKGDELNEWKYNYFKNHYLDEVDFTDARLLRTPILGKKIEYYIEKLTLQIPDSINKAADMIVSKSKPSPVVYRYVVHWITNHYEKSKIMGMDGVFVHMAEEYYCTPEGASWLDSATTAKICERAETLKPLLIGKVAENIILPDTTETKWYNLHKIESELTILVFWSPTCGHCKKAIPQLNNEVHKVYKDSGVFVFGVCTELENVQMKSFIKSHKLEFLNVSDSKEINGNAYDYLAKGLTTLNSLNFRTIYDIFSTPQVYVLDKDKKIIAKKLGIEQLPDFIKDYKKVQKEEQSIKN
ncbi:MAG: hypothetical protein CL840_13200 [Crocinitomicaceae bacterium]|nr:hypothetical protein [Crocinitomicaceae bacterium]|tara:strand:+ start:6705 stop:8231 length:1527 start_codon:yes stop_codon:yes gene_type:complete